MVIHLMRFSYSQHKENKLETFVDYPVDDFDLSTYVSSMSDKASYHYRLYAVSNHYGSLGGGHYTAYVYVSCNYSSLFFVSSSFTTMPSHIFLLQIVIICMFLQRFFGCIELNQESNSSAVAGAVTCDVTVPVDEYLKCVICALASEVNGLQVTPYVA